MRFWSFDTLWLAVLTGLLSLHVWFPQLGPGRLNDTYSVEISGRRAVYELAADRFTEVRRNHQSLALAPKTWDTDEALCLPGPGRYPTKTEWVALLEWVQRGGRLLIAARLEPNAGFEIPDLGAEAKFPEVELFNTPEIVAASAVKSRMLRPGSTVRWVSLGKAIGPPGSEVLVVADDEHQAVRIPHGSGWIVLVASDYVFSNDSLNRRDTVNAYLAYRLLRSVGGYGSLIFDESLNAAAQPTIEGLLLDTPLRPITLQLATLLLVFTWLGTRRFGGLLPKTLQPRHNIADHTDALGNLYFKRWDSGGTVKRYLDQLRMEFRLSATRRDAVAIERLARRAKMPVADVKQLFADAEAAISNRDVTRRDAARLVTRLAEFRRRVHAGS